MSTELDAFLTKHAKRMANIPDEVVRRLVDDYSIGYAVETNEAVGRHDAQVVPVRVQRSLSESALTIVSLMPVTEEPLRPEMAAFYASISAGANANVIAIGNPGVEYPAWSRATTGQRNKLTRRQSDALHDGDFSLVAQAVAGATSNVLKKETLTDTTTTVVAPSMAAAITGAGINYFIEAGARRMGFIDPAGFAPGKQLEMGKKFACVDQATYIATNHPEQRRAEKDVKIKVRRLLGSLGANLAYWRALAKGHGISATLAHASLMYDTDTHIHV